MRALVTVLALVAIAAPGEAQILRPFTVAVTGGTLGIGPEATYDINRLVSVRGSATFLGLSAHGSNSSYRYSGHARVSNFGGTIDLHPFANGFRLSAGARSTAHNRVRFTGIARNNRTFAGTVFTPEQVGAISGTVRARSVSPIATLGYVRSTVSGITVGFDAGVMFHGTPRPYDFSATGELGTNPNAQTEYQNQQRRIRNDVDGYKYYPVAQLSIGYRF